MEVQVAMVLLAIGMAGLYSMSVVQTKQTRRLTDVLPPADVPALNRAGDPWMRKLGVYASVEELVTPTGSILAVFVLRASRRQPRRPARFYILSKTRVISLSWYAWNYSPSYLGNSHYHRSYGNLGSYAEFSITGLPVGEYEVLTCYPALSSLGSAIPHQIYDGTTLRTTVNVNQKVATSEVSYNGRNWDRLAVVQINSGMVRVRLIDGSGARNYILADAILVRSARSFDVVSVAETAGGGATAILEAP